MSELTDALIEQHLKTLKLPAIRREYGQLARQAGADSWTYAEYLRELLDCEIRAREASTTARRLREARFPDLKTLGQIDWDAMQGVSKQQLLELATCQFIERPEDVVIAGPIGTGKSHLAIALGVEAAKRRFRVLFVKAADLVRQLLEARDDRELGRLQQPRARYRRPHDRRSRPQRWQDAVRTLLELQDEYQAWLDNLPDALQESALAQKLEAICGLDLAALESVEPPRGYGRD